MGVKTVAKQRVYGLAVYDEAGKRLYGGTFRPRREDDGVAKFFAQVDSLLWAVRKFKTLQQNNRWNETEPLRIFIASKTVYNWIDAGASVDPYRVQLADLLLEMGFIPNPTEIVLLDSALTKIPFAAKEKEQYQSVKDLYQ